MKLEDRRVLITGGGSGIGRAFAAEFARRNNRVMICGRDAGKLERVASEFAGVVPVSCDVSQPQERAHLVDSVSAKFGGLDILINNAGVQNVVDYRSEEPIEHVETEIAINLTAPVRLSEAFLPMLRAGGDSAIINITSPLGIVPRASVPLYGATKAGLRAFTKALRAQLEGTGVRVFEILPPRVDTPMTVNRRVAKIAADEFVRRVMPQLSRNKLEIRIGQARRILFLHRIAPEFTERPLRKL